MFYMNFKIGGDRVLGSGLPSHCTGALLSFYSRMGHADDEERAGRQEQKEARVKKRGGGRKNSVKREEDGERTGSMSRCMEGGVIPSSKKVITSNSVLMRLHGENKDKL